MIKQSLAISTVSLIRNKEEGKVVLETIKILSSLNIQVVIVDGGSPGKAKDKIKSLPNIIFLERRGLTNQLKTSFKRGAEVARSLFYLHTDKLDFVEKYAQKLIDFHSTLKPETMLIPTRSTSTFKTYPAFQRKIEMYLNFILSDYLDKKADYYFGPKIFSSKLVPYLDKLQGDIGWGIEAYFYALNKRLRLPMKFYECEAATPKDIGSQEEIKRYRLKILQWQIEGFLQGQAIKLKIKA